MSKSPPRFRAWKCDDTVIDTLKGRGWKYLGEPCKNGRENYPKSMFKAKAEGKIKQDECLYWCDDDDTRVLTGMSTSHLLSSLPGTPRALTKPFQQEMFNEYKWFPKCFTLPKEKSLMETYLKNNPNTYWIAKPRDSYGGFGMCVFKAGTPEFQKTMDRKCTFVVQQYLKNPYLMAGLYKFHIRGYMVITNAKDPLKAYLYKDAQIQFSTHKYDLNEIEKNFNKYGHITNYKVNNEKKNMKKVLQNKPGIGRGTEWSFKTFVSYMKKHEPKFSETKFWKQCADMSKTIAQELTNSKHVLKPFVKSNVNPTNHFELFGIDILMDENCNLYVTEANTQPGLEITKPVMLDGKFNPEIVKANNVTTGIMNDLITLLGIDNYKKQTSAPFINVSK